MGIVNYVFMPNNFIRKVKLIRAILKSSVPNIGFTPTASMILGGQPRFTKYNNQQALENEYYVNPVYSAIADLRSNYLANAEYKVRNIKTGEIISFKDFKENNMTDKILGNMFNIINNPNPLQSTKEFFGTQSIMKDTFGNQFTYGNFAGVKKDISSIATMWGVWPQYMCPLYNTMGVKIFSSLTREDIFKGWEFKWGTLIKEFENSEILHRKDTNISLKTVDDVVLGKSKLISLALPNSNIKIAYESRNIIAQDRGMRGIISSAEGDATGQTPMNPGSKNDLQDDFQGVEGYGFTKGQNQFLITEKAVNYQGVDQDVRKLGLLDEIASDAMIVANKYTVPEILIKLYLQGATFENQEKSEIRMYQNATIPEANDSTEDLNNWLRCRDYNFEYLVSFDHVAVLQEDLKNKSIVNLNNNRVYKDLFFSGGCTYNTWLQAIGAEIIEESWAKLRITEMEPNNIAIVTGKFNVNIQTNGE